MKQTSTTPQQDAKDDLDFGDIGLDFSTEEEQLAELFDITDEEPQMETRYIKPIVHRISSDFVLYDNAVKLAKDLRLDFGDRADAFISGSFIFGDFIEAYLVENHIHTKKMVISTLSLSQNNVDSLQGLMKAGYIDELQLIVSVYFYGNEIHSLIPYLYNRLDIDNRFQLAVAGLHTKTVHFETDGGRKIVMHGSANLRSSGNIEQVTIEENPQLFAFYDEQLTKIIDKYATIKKPVRHSVLWAEMIKQKFND